METIKNIQLNPELSDICFGMVNITYTGHAVDRSDEKGIMLPQQINISRGTVIEVYETDYKPTKVVVRVSYCSENDIVLVLVPDCLKTRYLRCVTVWLNNKEDNHATLRLKSA